MQALLPALIVMGALREPAAAVASPHAYSPTDPLSAQGDSMLIASVLLPLAPFMICSLPAICSALLAGAAAAISVFAAPDLAADTSQLAAGAAKAASEAAVSVAAAARLGTVLVRSVAASAAAAAIAAAGGDSTAVQIAAATAARHVPGLGTSSHIAKYAHVSAITVERLKLQFRLAALMPAGNDLARVSMALSSEASDAQHPTDQSSKGASELPSSPDGKGVKGGSEPPNAKGPEPPNPKGPTSGASAAKVAPKGGKAQISSKGDASLDAAKTKAKLASSKGGTASKGGAAEGSTEAGGNGGSSKGAAKGASETAQRPKWRCPGGHDESVHVLHDEILHLVAEPKQTAKHPAAKHAAAKGSAVVDMAGSMRDMAGSMTQAAGPAVGRFHAIWEQSHEWPLGETEQQWYAQYLNTLMQDACGTMGDPPAGSGPHTGPHTSMVEGEERHGGKLEGGEQKSMKTGKVIIQGVAVGGAAGGAFALLLLGSWHCAQHLGRMEIRPSCAHGVSPSPRSGLT